MTTSIWQSEADQAAATYNVPSSIFDALIGSESSWNPAIVSPKGAIGLTQLMPGTAQQLGVDPWNPVQNLNGGASYLSQLFQQYGNWTDALSAYNSGYPAAQSSQGAAYAANVLGQAGYTGSNAGSASTSAPPGSGQTLGQLLMSNPFASWQQIGQALGLPTSMTSLVSPTNIFLYAILPVGLLLVGYLAVKQLMED